MLQPNVECSAHAFYVCLRVRGLQIPKELPVQDGKLRFYWFDAYEDPYNQPGTLYLFGKVLVRKPDTFASCCVTVRGIERVMYVLPREKPDGTRFPASEVYKEVRTACVVGDSLVATPPCVLTRPRVWLYAVGGSCHAERASQRSPHALSPGAEELLLRGGRRAA